MLIGLVKILKMSTQVKVYAGTEYSIVLWNNPSFSSL